MSTSTFGASKGGVGDKGASIPAAYIYYRALRSDYNTS